MKFHGILQIMIRPIIKVIPFLLLFYETILNAQKLPGPEPKTERVLLPNGWSLSPIGKQLLLGDLPLNIAVSNSKKLLAITNNGESTQSLQLFDPGKEHRLDSVDIPKSWLGLKFSADEKFLYASGGNDNRILVYAIVVGKLILRDSILLGEKWPVKISPAGIELDDRRQILYVVTKENNSLYLVDLKTKKIIGQYPLPAEAYTCLLSRNGEELYISGWGCSQLLIFNTEKKTFSEPVTVGSNPNDMVLTRNGRRIYIANSNDNSVSVIDLQKRKSIETLNAALYPNAPAGSTTNGVALSENERNLYVANADNNCLAVFDVSQPGNSHSRGFIPVGWYPTAVKCINGRVFVANGKGLSSLPNPQGPSPYRPRQQVNYRKGDKRKPAKVQYIGGLFRGTLSIFPEPNDQDLARFSRMVYENCPYTKEKEQKSDGQPGNPIPMQVGAPSPIQYVFYIVKENRTYDQVLGDIPEGNGDTSLVLFGEHVTPNLHALATEFVLLDNFYCDAEVSADGHNWSLGAYADDYLEKTWPTSYGGRGGSYDGEGNRSIANNKNGFIWDYCSRAGVSYRSYGEFADDYKPNIPVLKNHICPYYTGFDLRVPDTTRYQQWKRDFDSLIKANALPRFNTVRFGNDHTEGLRKGSPTPFAHVADNDLAVGKFVEWLSHSPIWEKSVVFIIEDDAQNGPDHVDAHRTTAYVAGGYVKRHFIDHTLYSTTSMERTMELILGLPPMSQYDAAATPMWNCFGENPDPAPFRSSPSNIDLLEKNTAWNEWVKKSDHLDFTREDRVPEALFNEILWKGVRGPGSEVPAPRRAAFVRSNPQKQDLD
jgi:YVTN family beta-propeller protein